MTLHGQPDGAQVQLNWQADVDDQFLPVGEPMRQTGVLSGEFTLPRGLITVSVIGATAATFIAVTAFSNPTRYVKLSEQT